MGTLEVKETAVPIEIAEMATILDIMRYAEEVSAAGHVCTETRVFDSNGDSLGVIRVEEGCARLYPND